MENEATRTASGAIEARGAAPTLSGERLTTIMANKTAKLTAATSRPVTRNIIGLEAVRDPKTKQPVIDEVTKKPKMQPKKGKDGVNVTKDGQNHGATVTVAHMRAVTDAADFPLAWEEFMNVVDVIEDGGTLLLVDSKGKETPATPRTKCVDGKRVILAGKDLYPRTIKELPQFINDAVDAKAAAAITAFTNTFKSSYGGGGATAADDKSLDDNSDLA